MQVKGLNPQSGSPQSSGRQPQRKVTKGVRFLVLRKVLQILALWALAPGCIVFLTLRFSHLRLGVEGLGSTSEVNLLVA